MLLMASLDSSGEGPTNDVTDPIILTSLFSILVKVLINISTMTTVYIDIVTHRYHFTLDTNQGDVKLLWSEKEKMMDTMIENTGQYDTTPTNVDVDQLARDFEQLKREAESQRGEVSRILDSVETTVDVAQSQGNGSSVDLSAPVASTAVSAVGFGTPNDIGSSPLSLEIEKQCLTHHGDRLPFRTYLSTGYNYYKHWLQMTLGLDEGMNQHMNFCLARHMNSTSPNSMGMDLEIKYITKRLEDLFGYENMRHYGSAVCETIKENLGIGDMEAQQYAKDYLDKLPQGPTKLTLTNEEFSRRMQSVPTQVLDSHSTSLWRSSNPRQLNNDPYPLTREDIRNGEMIAPPSSKHQGLQMLQIHGYLDFIPSVNQSLNSRAPRPYSVTYF
jgi:hypothetical protein